MNLEDYVTVSQKCNEWGVYRQTVLKYLNNDRIPGAIKVGMQWFIPKYSQRPNDRRYRYNKSKYCRR